VSRRFGEGEISEETRVPLRVVVAVCAFVCSATAACVAAWYQVNARIGTLERRDQARSVQLNRIAAKLGIEQTWPLDNGDGR